MKDQTVAPTLPRSTPQLVVIIATAVFLFAASFQSASAQSLGAASSFAVEGGQSVTVGGTGTTINGDVGVSPGTSITGIPAGGTVTPPFTTHSNDGAAVLAQASTLSLYNALVALTPTGAILPQLNGQNLGPGVYSVGAADLAALGTFTLSGAGTYVFQVSSSLTANVGSNMVLNGVDPCQVFWQVTSLATLNGGTFVGNVVAQAGVTLGVNATLDGRALTTALGSVTMAGNNTVGGCSGSSPLSLLLKKQALTARFLNAGDAISYSYVVANTSATALSGPVTILDDRVAVTCPIVATLLSGDSITCSATYIATVADVAAGFITNNATAYEGSTVSNGDTTTVRKTAQAAAITIVKKTNLTDNNAPTGPIVSVGSAVHWTYIVKNTGNVTLTNVIVTDNQGVTVTCPRTVLIPGQSMTCTADGTAVAGQYTNFGTATGTPPTGVPVTAIDIDHYFGQPPSCPFPPPTISVFSVVNVPPVTVTLKVQAPGGLQSIVVTALTNATVVPASLIFTPGTTGAVYVVVQKVDASKGSVIGLEANDRCNVTIFDPVVVTVNPTRREAITLTGVAGDETLVQIVNDNLNAMRITVNGHGMPVIQLRAHETRYVDISGAMEPGDDNTIILEARGPKGSSALVTVYPPPASSAAAGTISHERRQKSHKHATIVDLP